MKNKTFKILGLMSGTSMDGLDCCYCKISINSNYEFDYNIIDFKTFSYSNEVKEIIKKARKRPFDSQKYDDILGKIFSEIAIDFLRGRSVDLVGNHGQTILHIDKKKTMQIGNPVYLLKALNVPIVYNFREKDILAGGNGAPLMPFLDWLLFKNFNKNTYTLNIGGISNLSKITKNIERSKVIGFDSGPGMCLIDEFVKKVWNKNMDFDSQLSSRGKIIKKIENDLLQNAYILKKPPKSTDRKDFGEEMIDRILLQYNNYSPFDILRTLVSFTAKSICINLKKYLKFNGLNCNFYINGGGFHHSILINDLKDQLLINSFSKLEDLNISEDNKEALLIAVLTLCRFLNLPANMSSVTGSKGDIVLGDILYSKDLK